MAKSKFFRVAVEGATTDGRVIERSWLTEMAATYNRATYGARVNMEHIRGITADKPFKAYGDVLSLKTDEVDIELAGKTSKKLALFAEIEPTDELVAMNRDKQKLYTSVEIAPNFAASGKAYLVGLAVTDSPASLGTELLTFAAYKPVLDARKQDAANLFSAAAETTIEFEADAPAPSESANLIKLATDFLKNFGKGNDKPEPVTPPVPANDNDARFGQVLQGLTQLTAAVGAVAGDVTKLTADLAAVKSEHATLKASVETTDANPQRRAPAAGGANFTATDC